jgi:hypothetical protein
MTKRRVFYKQRLLVEKCSAGRLVAAAGERAGKGQGKTLAYGENREDTKGNQRRCERPERHAARGANRTLAYGEYREDPKGNQRRHGRTERHAERAMRTLFWHPYSEHETFNLGDKSARIEACG